MYQRCTETQKGALNDESAAGRLAAHEGLRRKDGPYEALQASQTKAGRKRAHTWALGWRTGKRELRADKAHWREIHPGHYQRCAPMTPTRNGGPSTNAMRRKFHVADRVARDRGIAAARLRGLPKG